MKKNSTISTKSAISERDIQNDIRVALSEHGIITWRNNIGVTKFPDGSVVRYGLCNPGGSDLIGILPITITPDMVGQQIGAFLAVEIKRPGKKPTDDQRNFMNAVKGQKGYAGVATSVEEALSLINVF